MNNQKHKKTITILNGELWYSGYIDDTVNMPYDGEKEIFYDLNEVESVNQISPVLISTQGRFLYAPKNFVLSIKNRIITVSSEGAIETGYKVTFKKAYEFIKNKFFNFNGNAPDLKLFSKPQYCTWMSLNYNQTQTGVLAMAESIINDGLQAGEIIIDDNWAPYQGKFDFDKGRFPDPREMCNQLHNMGFSVTLWVVPYVSPDTENYRFFHDNGMLYKKDGKPFLTEWWDGFSACIDFTNPKSEKWFIDRFNNLRNKYGIDGFKMDGGDSRLYRNDLESFDGISHTALELSELYGNLAKHISLSEIRATNKCEGLPVIQRIADRAHAWEDERNGLDGIVKKTLVMSFTGYPFNCPDMVGGGLSLDWGTKEDDELNIRYMETATFLPCVQFSKKIWEYSNEIKSIVLKMLGIRETYIDYILSCVKNCAETGEPIIRTMLYEFGIMPDNVEQFMVGDKILVSPVIKKGQYKKDVYLPNGEWMYYGKKVSGGCWITVDASLDVLPYFVKVN